jgi:hypothetical protein
LAPPDGHERAAYNNCGARQTPLVAPRVLRLLTCHNPVRGAGTRSSYFVRVDFIDQRRRPCNAAPVGSPHSPPKVTVRRGLIGPVCPAGQVTAPACSSMVKLSRVNPPARPDQRLRLDHSLVTGVPIGGAGGCGGVGRIARRPAPSSPAAAVPPAESIPAVVISPPSPAVSLK